MRQIFFILCILTSLSAHATVFGFVVGPSNASQYPKEWTISKSAVSRQSEAEKLIWSFRDPRYPNDLIGREHRISRIRISAISKSKKGSLLIRNVGTDNSWDQDSSELSPLFKFNPSAPVGTNHHGMISLASGQSVQANFKSPLEIGEITFLVEAFSSSDVTIFVAAEFDDLASTDLLYPNLGRELVNSEPSHHPGNTSHGAVSECARRRLAWLQAIAECGRIEDPHDRDICVAAAGPDPGSCE